MLTESQHAGEFIFFELPYFYNRRTGTVASGQNLVDGQIVQITSTKLVAKATTLNTAGTAFVVPIEGIIIGNWNRSSTGPEGAADKADVPYLKYGPAIVVEEKITFPTGTTQKAVAIADLANKGILVRNTTTPA